MAARVVARSAVASEALEIDEAWSSLRLADSPLERADAEALLRRGVAVGGYKLEAYIALDDYAAAMRYVRAAPMPGGRQGFVSMQEIVALHRLVARRTSPRPGLLREVTLPAFPGGMVPAPAWLIPQSLTAFVERFRPGPPKDGSPIAWVADAHARYERIHPFDAGNGRVGRALANLLLKRCGLLPLVVRPGDAATYLAALRAADSRNPWPLASLIARSLVRSYALMEAHATRNEDVRPLSEFATDRERASLYKAAQRGRLRAFRRDGRLWTSARWIAEYRQAT